MFSVYEGLGGGRAGLRARGVVLKSMYKCALGNELAYDLKIPASHTK